MNTPICESCGNQYDKAFKVVMDSKEYTFDSFECAISALAPRCEHCKTRVIGHGVEVEGHMFCCAHCASMNNKQGAIDRVSSGLQSSAEGQISS